MQILCATDFTKPAVAAADVALAMAKKLGLPLRLLHCGADFVVMGDLPYAVTNDDPARAQLNAEATRLMSPEVEITAEFRKGVEWQEIVAAASEQPTRLIVLGSVVKGVAERWLIGSVAERVAESAPVPTLVIRQPDILLGWLNGQVDVRLLCAVDFTASADAAIAEIKELLPLGLAEIGAAHVFPDEEATFSEELRTLRQRDISQRLHAVLGDVPVKVHLRDASGQPSAVFLKTAQEQQSGLLVIGTHQRHGWERLKISSFSRNVLSHAAANVLCVPATSLAQDISIPDIRRVLVAIDFSDASVETLRQAHGLLRRGGAIHLVHVYHPPAAGVNPVIASKVYFDHSMASAKAKEEAEAKMKAFPPSLLDVPGVAITTAVLAGNDIAATLWNCAKIFGADIICAGTKRHSRLEAALFGSTIEALLAQARKPVFVVPPPAE